MFFPLRHQILKSKEIAFAFAFADWHCAQIVRIVFALASPWCMPVRPFADCSVVAQDEQNWLFTPLLSPLKPPLQVVPHRLGFNKALVSIEAHGGNVLVHGHEGRVMGYDATPRRIGGGVGESPVVPMEVRVTSINQFFHRYNSNSCSCDEFRLV